MPHSRSGHFVTHPFPFRRNHSDNRSTGTEEMQQLFKVQLICANITAM
jgi:hypothetical protein